VGNITIRFINNNNKYSSLATNHSFKYVVVPESVSAKSSGKDFKKMTYEEVMDQFGWDFR